MIVYIYYPNTVQIPTPQEIGLPAKFDKFRSTQEEALSLILESKKRVTALSIPTGIGKSVINVAAALLSQKPTCIVTNSKGLQSQYMRDFEEIGMVDIRGRNNYTCDLKPDYTCEEGYASRCPYKGTVACPSSAAEMRAATSSLVTTNYSKWTSAKKFGQGMSHFQQVIFDEGHDTYSALASAMQVTLNHKEIEETLKVKFLSGDESMEFPNWKPWAAHARGEAEAAMIVAQGRISGVSDPKPSHVRHYTHMRNLCRRLATIALASAKDWIVDQTETGFQFDPIRPGKYAESALLLRVPRIIIVSATLRPKSLFMIGIGKDKFDYKEFASEFDPKRCPIYYTPTMRVDRRNPDLTMLWAKFDQIAARRQDRNGIVHTHSYARRDDILGASRFSNRMIINPKGEPTADTVEQFLEAERGSILVSPSVGTGYDFAGKAAEYQFLCKIPFPDSRSKIVKARQQDDPEYGPHQAMQSMVQAIGRGMRSKTDQCETFIADENLDWFMPRFGHLAPKSFHGFFRRVDVLPTPPQRLL